MSRDTRAGMAQETLRILNEGEYITPSGRVVSIADALAEAIAGTRLHEPSDFPQNLTADILTNSQAAHITVTPESTLEAARRLARENPDDVPCCLNFASAKNPGGGFLGGSQAQEEALARSSGLYPCLTKMQAFYDFHRSQHSCLYSDYMIYSPRVPIFRDDAGSLLETPYLATFLTSPAPNAGAVRQNEPENSGLIASTLRERMRKLLWLAHTQQNNRLVLGAWGCGVFQNDPHTVARLFAELLCPGGEFSSMFQEVVFAIYDRSAEQTTLKAFEATFML